MGSSKPTSPKDEMEREALEWIRFREEVIGPTAYSEPPGAKLWRRIKENPFVPIGAFATLGALSYGLWCFRQGRTRYSQMLMRARIAAQGFTIFALLGGVAFGVTDHRKPEVNAEPALTPHPSNS